MNLYESIKKAEGPELKEGNTDLGYIAEYFPTEKEAKEFAVKYYKEGKFDKITKEGNEYAVHVFHQPKTNNNLPTDDEVNKFLKDAEDLKEAFELPNVNQLVEEINKYVPAEPVEDEEGITIKVMGGLLKIDPDGLITFSADWLTDVNNSLTFRKLDDFLHAIQTLADIFK